MGLGSKYGPHSATWPLVGCFRCTVSAEQPTRKTRQTKAYTAAFRPVIRRRLGEPFTAPPDNRETHIRVAG